MRKPFYIFICCVIILAFSLQTLYSFDVPSIDTQKFPVVMYGDYLEYKTKAQKVISKGNSYITYQDMKISADTIQANIETEDIFAYGDVDFWKGYDQTSGDFMVYNVRTGEGWMRDATIKNKRNFFTATEVYVSPRKAYAQNVMQTTCEHLDNPHYSLRAESLEVVPGKSMTMENLSLKWKNKVLFSKAHNYSNSTKSEKFFSTRQGYSQIDGMYLKFMTAIELTSSFTGKVSLDYFQRRGQGFGFDGIWKSGERSDGSIYVYSLDEHLRDRSSSQVNLTYNYRFPSGSTLNNTLNYSADKRPGYAQKKDLTVYLNYRPILSFMNMTLTANKYYDLDGDREALDAGYQVLNRLPEINFSFPAYTLQMIPITLNFSGMYGAYQEGTLADLRSTEKKDAKFNFTSPQVKVNRRFNITPTYNFHKNYYTGGIERENRTTGIRANHKFSACTSLELNYNLATSEGRSPFQFDSFTSTDVISTRLKLSENTWTLNPLNFNYNRVRQQLEQVYMDYSKRSYSDSDRMWEFFVRQDLVPESRAFSDMNLSNFKFGNLNTRYRMATNLWSFDTNITIPYAERKISNTSFNYRAIIRPLWQISTSGNYNHLTEKFSPLTIGVTRDLHCWEMKAGYNHTNEEVWLEFYLKASPNDSGKFRYGMQDNLLQAKLSAYDQITSRYEGLGY